MESDSALFHERMLHMAALAFEDQKIAVAGESVDHGDGGVTIRLGNTLTETDGRDASQAADAAVSDPQPLGQRRLPGNRSRQMIGAEDAVDQPSPTHIARARFTCAMLLSSR